jgi:hypothetical protein
MNIETGGPAFPNEGGLGHLWNDKGMDLRDYFAAKAIPFIQWNSNNTSLCAKRCYEIADAMLEARK